MSAAAKIVVMTAEEFTEALSRVAEASARRALELAQSRGLTKSQAAAALNRSTATIDRWVAAGMPHDGVGARCRFDLEACRAWLRDRPRVATNILTEGVTRKKRRRREGGRW